MWCWNALYDLFLIVNLLQKTSDYEFALPDGPGSSNLNPETKSICTCYPYEYIPININFCSNLFRYEKFFMNIDHCYGIYVNLDFNWLLWLFSRFDNKQSQHLYDWASLAIVLMLIAVL